MRHGIFIFHKNRGHRRNIVEFAEEFTEFAKNSKSPKIGFLFFELEASGWRGSIRLVKAIWTNHRINSGYVGKIRIYRNKKHKMTCRVFVALQVLRMARIDPSRRGVIAGARGSSVFVIII